MAFLAFKEARVDAAVIETGLGGRLDATNVIRPVLSIITGVAMDHEAWLGDTIEKISREKAGIIKEGVPVAAGRLEGAARAVVEEAARRRKAPLFLLGRDFHAQPSRGSAPFSPLLDFKGFGLELSGLPTALSGHHQVENAGLAAASALILEQSGLWRLSPFIPAGLRTAWWPCRLEFLKGPPPVLLDGAHNTQGIGALVNALRSGPLKGLRPGVLLWGASDEGGTKDARAMMESLLPLVELAVATMPPGPRHPAPLEAYAGLPKTVLEPDWTVALERAKLALKRDTYLLVAGSLYLAGAVRARLTSGTEG